MRDTIHYLVFIILLTCNPVAMRILLALAFILSGSMLSFGQGNKFSHSLAEYNISLQIDTAVWRRITYAEMTSIYRQNKLNFDDFLDQQKAVAMFLYVPRDSITIKDQTSITITIDTISGSTAYARAARDTIESSKTLLQSLRGGMKDKLDHGPSYFDKTTNSQISKHSVIIVKPGEGISENNKVGYLVVQTKEAGRKRLTIEYRCFTYDEAQYFPSFQKMISSFR